MSLISYILELLYYIGGCQDDTIKCTIYFNREIRMNNNILLINLTKDEIIRLINKHCIYGTLMDINMNYTNNYSNDSLMIDNFETKVLNMKYGESLSLKCYTPDDMKVNFTIIEDYRDLEYFLDGIFDHKLKMKKKNN